MISNNFAEEFFEHEVNRKKIKALYHFSMSTDKFTDNEALKFLMHWINHETLDSEGENFVNFLLDKYDIDYLDWATNDVKWLTDQIDRKSRKDAYKYFYAPKKKKRVWKQLSLF